LPIAVEVDPAEDLRPLSEALRQNGVPHRVFEASGRLKLEVPDERLVEPVRELWGRMQRGEVPSAVPSDPPSEAGQGAGLGTALLDTLRRSPFTAFLVAIVVCFFPATWGADGAPPDFTLRWLMIVPIERVGDFIQFTTLEHALSRGEFWRLWTPALLHFGGVHLVFNLLWLWEFGRRVEAQEGVRRLLILLLVVAAVSNVVQYLWAERPVFGGLSGAVYGLLGYLVTAWRRTGWRAYALPAALVVMLVLFLVLMSTGVTEPFGLNIANAAHWAGFLAGIVVALAWRPRAVPD
jgi:GlpG protein